MTFIFLHLNLHKAHFFSSQIITFFFEHLTQASQFEIPIIRTLKRPKKLFWKTSWQVHSDGSPLLRSWPAGGTSQTLFCFTKTIANLCSHILRTQPDNFLVKTPSQGVKVSFNRYWSANKFCQRQPISTVDYWQQSKLGSNSNKNGALGFSTIPSAKPDHFDKHCIYFQMVKIAKNKL